MGKRKSGLTSVKDGKGFICLMPQRLRRQMQSLPCALREVIQSTHNFTAMTICTRMNKLQGHDEKDMSVRWVSWMPTLASGEGRRAWHWQSSLQGSRGVLSLYKIVMTSAFLMDNTCCLFLCVSHRHIQKSLTWGTKQG